MTNRNYVYMNGYCRSKSLPIEMVKKIIVHLGLITENDEILPKGAALGIVYKQ